MCAQAPHWCDSAFLSQVAGCIVGGVAGAPTVTPAPTVKVAKAGVPVGGMIAVGAAADVEAAAAAAAAAEPEDVAFPLRFDRKAACAAGGGIAVHLARQLVIISGHHDQKLHCYNLGDGVEVSVVGRGNGAGDMQFNWNRGGVCVSPRGTLLVADHNNHRVPEVDLGLLDRFVRVFGDGYRAPEFWFAEYVPVDCNEVHVAVSEAHRVSVLSCADGSLVCVCG